MPRAKTVAAPMKCPRCAEMEKTISDLRAELHRRDIGIQMRDWRLIGPDGKVHEFTNLQDWCKSNAGLFAPHAWRAAMNGIYDLKASHLGRKRRPYFSWYGWTIDPTIFS